MATLPYEELNNIESRKIRKRDSGNRSSETKRRSIPYNEFFGEMYLTEDEKETRIQMANALDDVFVFMFATLALITDVGEITYPVIYEMAERRYKDAIEPFLTARALESMSIDNIIANQVRLIVDTTMKHIDDPYYTSDDRAMYVAENQANVIQNAVNEEEAIEAGYTHKTWVTMRDPLVRQSHRDADGQTVPIMHPFSVGDSLLGYPCDSGYGADAQEIAGCRCTVEYSKQV